VGLERSDWVRLRQEALIGSTERAAEYHGSYKEHNGRSLEVSYPQSVSPAWPAQAQRHVCIPQIGAEYVARMEDVLDLYAEQPIPAAPG
jgi:hypothetical protein